MSKINERFIIVQLGGTLFVYIYFLCSTHIPVKCDLLCVILDELGLELAKYPGHNIVIGSDMNTDLRLSSRGANAIRDFTNDNNLLISSDRVALGYDHTYVNDGLGHSSMLDFFILSPGLFCDLVSIALCDDPSNLSDHLPVKITIKCRAVMKAIPHLAANDPEPVREKKLRWDKANLNNYYNLSYTSLSATLTQLEVFYARITHEANFDPAPGGGPGRGARGGRRGEALPGQLPVPPGKTDLRNGTTRCPKDPLTSIPAGGRVPGQRKAERVRVRLFRGRREGGRHGRKSWRWTRARNWASGSIPCLGGRPRAHQSENPGQRPRSAAALRHWAGGGLSGSQPGTGYV